jgi:hypothetical protein
MLSDSLLISAALMDYLYREWHFVPVAEPHDTLLLNLVDVSLVWVYYARFTKGWQPQIVIVFVFLYLFGIVYHLGKQHLALCL